MVVIVILSGTFWKIRFTLNLYSSGRVSVLLEFELNRNNLYDFRSLFVLSGAFFYRIYILLKS